MIYIELFRNLQDRHIRILVRRMEKPAWAKVGDVGLSPISAVDQNVRRLILNILSYMLRGHEIDMTQFRKVVAPNRYEKSRRAQVSEHLALLILMSDFPYKGDTLKDLMWNTHSRIVSFLDPWAGL